MNNQERDAIWKAVTADYVAGHGPRADWSKHTTDRFHEELGVMVSCVHILRSAGLLPPRSDLPNARSQQAEPLTPNRKQ